MAGPLDHARCIGRHLLGRSRGGGLERRRRAHRRAPGCATSVGRRRSADHPDGRYDGRAPATGESEEEMGRRWWSERDAAMAGRALAAPDAPGGRLVVAGNLHTRLEPLPAEDPIGAEIGVPMGAELARQRPGLCVD